MLTLKALVFKEVEDSVTHQKENTEICVTEECACVCLGVIHLLWLRSLGHLVGNFQGADVYVGQELRKKDLGLGPK